MNANELADKLENTISLGYPSKMESQEVIAMLRQQQAEIEALKDKNEDLMKQLNRLLKHYGGMAQELEKLKTWCGKTQPTGWEKWL